MLHRHRTPRSEVPTSSMADIAFLLLIFFLVTTVFDEERGLKLVLPSPETVPVAPENILVLDVRADGVIELRHGDTDRVQLVRAADIPALWRVAVQQRPGLIAALYTDPRAPYRYMIDVLDALRSAGAGRVSIGMSEPTGVR